MAKDNKLWKAVERHLLSAQDIETVILKGHLLIETTLNDALKSTIGPDYERIGLRFAQKLELLTCVWPRIKSTSIIGPRSLYDDRKELNSVRNKIAHQLTPLNMRTLLIDWVTASLGYKLRTIGRTTVLKRNIVKVVAMEVAYFTGQIETHKYIGSNKALQAIGAKARLQPER